MCVSENRLCFSDDFSANNRNKILWNNTEWGEFLNENCFWTSLCVDYWEDVVWGPMIGLVSAPNDGS